MFSYITGFSKRERIFASSQFFKIDNRALWGERGEDYGRGGRVIEGRGLF